MEINGEIHYATVDVELDVGSLAETLAIDHNFVDDVVLHNYVDERINDYELKVEVDDLARDVDELRERTRGLSPDNNYVRINDLEVGGVVYHTIIKEAVDARLIELFTRIIKEG